MAVLSARVPVYLVPIVPLEARGGFWIPENWSYR